jgi:hypothetical protein
LWRALARSCLEAGDHAGASSALEKFVVFDHNAAKKLRADVFWAPRVADGGEFNGLLN